MGINQSKVFESNNKFYCLINDDSLGCEECAFRSDYDTCSSLGSCIPDGAYKEVMRDPKDPDKFVFLPQSTFTRKEVLNILDELVEWSHKMAKTHEELELYPDATSKAHSNAFHIVKSKICKIKNNL